MHTQNKVGVRESSNKVKWILSTGGRCGAHEQHSLLSCLYKNNLAASSSSTNNVTLSQNNYCQLREWVAEKYCCRSICLKYVCVYKANDCQYKYLSFPNLKLFSVCNVKWTEINNKFENNSLYRKKYIQKDNGLNSLKFDN